MTLAAVPVRTASADGTGQAPFPSRAVPFIWHYVKRRHWLFTGLLLVLTGAAGCALLVQVAMRLLVDGMAAQEAARFAVWLPLILFVVLIGLESLCWHLGGLLTCRGVIATEVDVRLDLFDHLSGHPMRYFADHLAGSLGGRITATARTVGGLLTRFSWSILPPCADFVGAFFLFLTVDWRMSAALAVFALCLVAAMAGFADRGRPLHEAFAERSSRSSGEVVDAVANIWLIKAFSARRLERERLARSFSDEARTQTRSWLHVEKTRNSRVRTVADRSGDAGLVHPSLDRGRDFRRRGGHGERHHLPRAERFARGRSRHDRRGAGDRSGR
jgi:ATP-binding cassette subfamily B protein